jgi:hypothetical protein
VRFAPDFTSLIECLLLLLLLLLLLEAEAVEEGGVRVASP